MSRKYEGGREVNPSKSSMLMIQELLPYLTTTTTTTTTITTTTTTPLPAFLLNSSSLPPSIPVCPSLLSYNHLFLSLGLPLSLSLSLFLSLIYLCLFSICYPLPLPLISLHPLSLFLSLLPSYFLSSYSILINYSSSSSSCKSVAVCIPF